MVVGPPEHRFPVVIYGLSAHHSHPSHNCCLLISRAAKGPSGRGNRSVAIVFEKKWLRGKRVKPWGEKWVTAVRGELGKRKKPWWRLEEGLSEKSG